MGILPLLGAGSNVIFSPPNISGLVVWLKADSLSLNDGDAVATWTDSSGTGNTASQSVALNRPTYKTNILNGLPVVRFASVSVNYMTIATPLLFNTSGANASMFIVIKQTTSATVGVLSVGNGGWFLRYTSVTSASYAHVGQTVITQTVVNQFNVLQVRRAGLNTEIGVNGTLQAPVLQGGYTVATGLANYIGVLTDALGNPMNGDIAEIVLYNTTLTDPQQLQVARYLGGKYGITVA